jgi:hypothetical protein
MDQLLKNTGFRIHLIVYAAVNALLITINLLSPSNVLWFQWPLLGWGMGILGHAFLVLRAEKSARPSSSQPVIQEQKRMGAAEIQTFARSLWEAHGSKAIAEAAQKARSFEEKSDLTQGQTWRRIEEALKQMHGPHTG